MSAPKKNKLTKGQFAYLKAFAPHSVKWQKNPDRGNSNKRTCEELGITNSRGYFINAFLRAHKMLNNTGTLVTERGYKYIEENK